MYVPLLDGAHGCDDEERPTVALARVEVVKQRDGLNRFALFLFLL
jgi:hypothetical protein